jgi:hypothetical protein
MSHHSYSAGYDQGFQHATGKLLKELAEVRADLEKTTMRCIDSDNALAEVRSDNGKLQKELKDTREALRDAISAVNSCTELHKAKNIEETTKKGGE